MLKISSMISEDEHIIQETGPKFGQEFLIDSVYDNRVSNIQHATSVHSANETLGLWTSKVPLTYDILVTPRGDFSIPRTALEVNSIVTLKKTTRRDTAFHEIKIKPSVIVRTTEDFRSMSVKRRKCYYRHEVKLDYYPEYSEANCVLECAWKEGANKCGCIPWFLKDQFKNMKFCEVFGNICFKDIIDRRYETKEKACHAACLDDCEKVEFQLEQSRKPLKPYATFFTGNNFYCNTGHFAT